MIATKTSKAPKVLDSNTHDPSKQLPVDQVVLRIIALAQAMMEKKFYVYQVEFAKRLIESVLEHDGDTLTVIMSRQAGKTEVVGSIVAALSVILPYLAKMYPDDWRLNITDDRGVYRGFATGFRVGIYAPRLDQSAIMFDRVKLAFASDTSKKILAEMGLFQDVNNGNTLVLSSRSSILCESASEQSKIEGQTFNLLIMEEAQDISDEKIRKSLLPMVSSTSGTVAMVGTASTRKCEYYSAIKHNERMALVGHKRNNFCYPYTVCQKYNSLYKKFIEGQKLKLGENSDEFRMSYGAEWIFERGMFVTQNQLFNRDTAQVDGFWSHIYPYGIHKHYRHYSLVVGIDWGKSSDSTSLTLMAVDWLNPYEAGVAHDFEGDHSFIFYKKHILYWLEFLGDNYEYQFWEIYDYLRKLVGLKKIVTDSNTCGQPIYDRLVASFANDDVFVEPCNFQSRVKSDLYKSFYADLCGQRITFPAGDEARKTLTYRKFVYQMLDLQKEYHKGLMRCQHPDEKGAHDDFCFPGGCKVLSDKGELPIERIKVGDKVLTRKGFKKVIKTFKRRKELFQLGNIIGTSNHPIFDVKRNMYVPLDLMTLGDRVLTLRPRFVSIAERTIRHGTREKVCFVPQNVSSVIGQPEILQKYRNTIRRGEKVPVFNLEVEECNEYFCQGVLVHNCDSAAMAAWGCNTPADTGELELLNGNIFYK